MATTLLVHGGFWEGMDARRYWEDPGVAPGLRDAGHPVLCPERQLRAGSWEAETDHLLARSGDDPVRMVAGSNACTLAVRFALARPNRVRGLVLVHPATAGVPELDDPLRAALTADGLDPSAADRLLAGDTLRGVDDDELSVLDLPVALVPSVAGDRGHRPETVERLRALLPRPVVLPARPAPPHPDFAAHRAAFVDDLLVFLAGGHRFPATPPGGTPEEGGRHGGTPAGGAPAGGAPAGGAPR